MQIINTPIGTLPNRGEDQGIPASDGCCTTEDGDAVCSVPQTGQLATCGCQPPSVRQTVAHSEIHSANRTGISPKVRSGLLFALACITSPCCTPLIVPFALALLAGTLVAAWLGHNLGWLYGALTLISVISVVIGLRWMNRPHPSKPTAIQLSVIPSISLKVGDKAHAE